MHLAITSEADWYAAPRRALLGDFSEACGCGGACDHSPGLGALVTPMEAMRQAGQGETGRDFDPGGWVALGTGVENMVTSGQVNAAAWSPNCAGMPAPNINMFQTASGLALGTTAAGVGILGMTHVLAASAIPVAGVVIAGVGAVISIISTIFNHHTAAVRQEQQLGCAAIAAGNNAIALIDQAVRSGQMNPGDAAAGLDVVISKISAFVAPAVKHNPCNANCELLVQFKAIVIYRKALYAAMADAQHAGTSSALPATHSGGALVPTAQTVPGGGGTLVPMTTQLTPGTQVDLTTGATVRPTPVSVTPPWLKIAAAVAIAFVLMGRN